MHFQLLLSFKFYLRDVNFLACDVNLNNYHCDILLHTNHKLLLHVIERGDENEVASSRAILEMLEEHFLWGCLEVLG